MAEKDLHKTEPQAEDRGRGAETPTQIPKRGWKDILKRTKEDAGRDHVTIVAGGVAFFTLLGIVPGLAAVISIYAWIADPAQVQEQFAAMRGVVPEEAYQLLNDQMKSIASSSTAAGWGAVLGVLLSIWGGSKAMKALIEGLNIMYDEEERRGFIKLNIYALLLTLAAAVGVIVAVGLIAVLPAVIDKFGLGESAEMVVTALRWPLLLVFFMTALSVLYRFAPSRDEPQWKWVSWGAVGATALWLAGSGLFSLYVTYFDSYNKTYGSLGAVVILLMWFYLSAYAILLGAELNTEMERQTAKDTTKGAPAPMGQRNAHAADTLGESKA